MPPSQSENNAYSAPELADAVNGWCEEHGFRPLNKQIALLLNERNIYYYRSQGLISAPGRGRGKGFGEKQLLQLIAIRILQAKGLPHRRIQELLYGRSLEELHEIRCRGLAESLEQPVSPRTKSPSPEFPSPESPSPESPSPESRNVIPIGNDFLLVNRSGRHVAPKTLERIRELLCGRTTKK